MSHAAERALERYGLVFDGSDLKAIAAMCADSRRSILIRLCPGDCEERYVTYNSRALRVVYLPERSVIVTILPFRWRPKPPQGKKWSAGKKRRMRRKLARMAADG